MEKKQIGIDEMANAVKDWCSAGDRAAFMILTEPIPDNRKSNVIVVSGNTVELVMSMAEALGKTPRAAKLVKAAIAISGEVTAQEGE